MNVKPTVKQELIKNINSIKQSIIEKEEELTALKTKRMEYEKELFLLETPYRDGDIAEVNISQYLTKREIKECRLELEYVYGYWRFKAFPRRKDGEFSLRHSIVYRLANIIRKVEKQ